MAIEIKAIKKRGVFKSEGNFNASLKNGLFWEIEIEGNKFNFPTSMTQKAMRQNIANLFGDEFEIVFK